MDEETKQRKLLAQGDGMKEQRSMRNLVTRLEADQLWDGMQAKDVPQELVEYLQDQVALRKEPEQIRKALGIKSVHDPAWRKIVSAFNQGYRINGPALVYRMLSDHMKVGENLRHMIDDAMENGVEVQDGEGGTLHLKGLTKELAMGIDAWGRNNERFLAMAMKTGMMRDPLGAKGGGGQGTTIVVQSNIQFPSVEEIKRNQEEMAEKAKAIEVGRAKPT